LNIYGNDCKNDNIYKYEFENQCIKYCPNNTFYNENDKICLYYNNYTNSNDIININTNLISLGDDIQITDNILINNCHDNCKECNTNMKCISCKNDYIMINGTQNCVNIKKYPNYFIYINYLYPCSFLNSGCYECDPFLSDDINNICISCKAGYIYNEINKRCETCKENEYPITTEHFDSCLEADYLNCELYKTNCISLMNEELDIICKNNYNKTCMISNNKKLIFINWFKESFYNISYPSYNINNNDYLLIELTLDSIKRKVFFYNEEGRGLFDEINDKIEMNVENKRGYLRKISSSLLIKINNSEEYKYLFNFENNNNNFELINIKTGDIIIDNLFNFFFLFDYTFLDIADKPTTYLLELNEKNQFLLANFAKYRKNNKIVILYFNCSLQDSNIESLIKINKNFLLDFSDINFNIYARFYFIQTKKEYLYLSFVSEKNELYYYNFQENIRSFIYTLSNKMSFQKLLLIKDEIKLLSYYSSDKHIVFLIFETINNNILEYQFKKYLPYTDNNDYADIIFLSEVKAVFILERFNSITIFILDFFNNYKNFLSNEFLISVNEKEINNLNIYSLIFKYRNMLGLNFKNEDENGFILFGYYNSTDPKQILDIKKDGLYYNINLGNYLNLQSNIFDYEIKCIRIIDVPNIDISGLYLFSNITKNYIKKMIVLI
jgi:hypothetical protein